MFLHLTTASPPFRGSKILINSENINSVFIDEVKWVNKESDADPDAAEKELVTCISVSSIANLYFVQESLEEVHSLLNT